ncbi:MAG: hydroxymethylglutaryl-CoA synthase [Candidatus Thermoplasmatota archaeon]
MQNIGIVSYGAYIPKYRITPKDIGAVWGVDGIALGKALGIISKSVPNTDEDTITISIEAARNAIRRWKNRRPKEIGAIYVGSESHPYAVKPSAVAVAEAIEASPNLTAADYEFACKAGTAAIQTCMGLVGAGMIKYGIAIGADTSQSAPGDALEYSASAGGAAFIIGKEDIIANINNTCSYTTDTPDFWRREGQAYPSHGGRFTGEPAYFKHIVNCGKKLFSISGKEPKDYKYAVFHQPNGKFPLKVAKQLGFNDEQSKVGLLTPLIGNTYSASVPLGLCAVLDVAMPGDRVFVVAYGSGAGSDGFDIEVTDRILEFERNEYTVRSMVEKAQYIDYATYAKYMGKILLRE